MLTEIRQLNNLNCKKLLSNYVNHLVLNDILTLEEYTKSRNANIKKYRHFLLYYLHAKKRMSLNSLYYAFNIDRSTIRNAIEWIMDNMVKFSEFRKFVYNQIEIVDNIINLNQLEFIPTTKKVDGNPLYTRRLQQILSNINYNGIITEKAHEEVINFIYRKIYECEGAKK